MQHEIEDKDQLINLENAWKQVESTHNSELENTIIQVLNAIDSESMQVVSQKDDEKEVEHDDFDRDEDGNVSGGSWTEIEVRTEFEIQCTIPPELNSKFQQIDPNELSNTIESLIANAFSTKKPSPIEQFIKNLEVTTGVELEDLVEYIGYEPSTGEFNLVVQSAKQDESSHEATADFHDRAELAKDPYKYYGVSRSDFI